MSEVTDEQAMPDETTSEEIKAESEDQPPPGWKSQRWQIVITEGAPIEFLKEMSPGVWE